MSYALIVKKKQRNNVEKFVKQVYREQRSGAFERAEQRDGGGQSEDLGGPQSPTVARTEGESRSADPMRDGASVELNTG